MEWYFFCYRLAVPGNIRQNFSPLNNYPELKPTMIIKCSKCRFETDNSLAFQRHMNFVHTIIYNCSWCSFSCTSNLYWRQHLNHHRRKDVIKIRKTVETDTSQQNFNCELCNYTTTKIEKLKTHINLHMKI